MDSERNISKKGNRRIKFHSKLIIMFLVLILCISTLLTYQNMRSSEAMFKEEMQVFGFTLAGSAAEKMKLAKSVEEEIDKLIANRILQACEAVDLVDIEEMSNEKLTELAKKLMVDGGIYVIGPDRKVVFSDVVDYVGWEYPTEHPMDPVFNGSQRTYMEEIRKDLVSGELNKYGGMALTEKGYYIQIGVKATTIEEVMADFSPNILLSEIEKEDDVIYAMMIDTNGIAYAGTESMLSDEPYTDAVTINAIKNGISGASFWQDKEQNQRAFDVQVPYYEGDELKGSICIGIKLDRMETMLKQNTLTSVIFTVIMCSIGTLILLLSIRFLLKPLKKLSIQLRDISKGDFTVEQETGILRQQDELGTIARAVQSMRSELSTLVTGLRGDANHVEASADTLSTIMKDTTKALEENAQAIEVLANSATEQSDEVNKVAKAVDSLSLNVDQGKERLNNANDQVVFVNNLSQDGKNIIGDLEKVTVESIGRVAAVSKGVNTINETVLHMREFMGRIRSISDQTNLLALNSSIEAARAGEAGRGFAVIGDEIRKLANETKLTTEQVEAIIEDITFKTSTAAEDIVSIRDVNAKQKNTLQETLQIFGQIQEAVVKLHDSMISVVDANDSVSVGKDIIINAISELAALTENLSATCEEISASTEEQLASVEEINNLSISNRDVANKLATSVSRFKTIT